MFLVKSCIFINYGKVNSDDDLCKLKLPGKSPELGNNQAYHHLTDSHYYIMYLK